MLRVLYVTQGWVRQGRRCERCGELLQLGERAVVEDEGRWGRLYYCYRCAILEGFIPHIKEPPPPSPEEVEAGEYIGLTNWGRCFYCTACRRCFKYYNLVVAHLTSPIHQMSLEEAEEAVLRAIQEETEYGVAESLKCRSGRECTI